jgi:hypothetical protein
LEGIYSIFASFLAVGPNYSINLGA